MPTEGTLVSLIISTRGRTTPLERLCESFGAQEHKNFEVIVVDQNSDNRLGPLCEGNRWPFPLCRVRTPGESGLSRGRNSGWRFAKGTVIVFPDDDCAADLIPRSELARQRPGNLAKDRILCFVRCHNS